MMRRSLPLPNLVLSCVALACAALSQAEIGYSVRPLPEAAKLRVSMVIEAKAGTVELQMPNWAPGSYRLVDNFRNVQELEVRMGGSELKVDKPNDYTWSVSVPSDGTVGVTYTVPSPLTDGAMHYSGPSTYLYVVGRKDEVCTLTLDVPETWRVAVGLDAVRGKRNAFAAQNYDVLADNPVTLGDFIQDEYFHLGKPHYIVYRGANRMNIDRDYVKKACVFITKSMAHFFGGLPYNKYVWHFNVTPAADGGGGLEHLSSTQITLGVGAGPRSMHVLAHEFFHLWNVKRIRSKPLGPFDYTQLPQTGALWLLEGVTDYYASLLMFRYGWWDEEEFKEHITGNVSAVRRNPARLEVGPYEASWRVREAANGRGNSNGHRISYYDLGWVAGMCLDIEIRYRSAGKHSLDDVILALWEQCRDGRPGFEEDEIRKQCVRFGGPELGPFYDRIILRGGEMPVEEQLEKVGLGLAERMTLSTDPGFDWIARGVDPAPRVLRTRGSASSVLQANDLILSVGDSSCEGRGTEEVAAKANATFGGLTPDVPVRLKVKRGEDVLDVTLTPTARTQTSLRIVQTDFATPEKRRLRLGWYYGGDGTPPRVP